MNMANAIIEALQHAGYELEHTNMYYDGEHVALTVAKDGIRQRFVTSLSLSQAGIDEMLAQVTLTHEHKRNEP
jgi:hypothetical protein